LRQEPGRIYRLAVVISSGRDEPPTAAFLDELREQGFVEGKNLEFIPAGSVSITSKPPRSCRRS
jgi:hypothetical protein